MAVCKFQAMYTELSSKMASGAPKKETQPCSASLIAPNDLVSENSFGPTTVFHSHGRAPGCVGFAPGTLFDQVLVQARHQAAGHLESQYTAAPLLDLSHACGG